MIKIVHCADVHLDSPFALSDPRNAEFRRMEMRVAFSNLIMHAKNYGARLFLISGDLFDDDYVSKDTINLIIKEIASYPDCKFFIAPGESDCYNAKSPYRFMKWSENVHIFKSSDLTRVEVPELKCDVYGYGFTSPTLEINPFANKKPQNQDRINILVGHGDIASANSKCCPISKLNIADSGFDYIALGHLHNGTGVVNFGNTFFSYPGCLESRNFDENGHKGAMCGEIDKGVCNLKGVKFSRRRFETVKIDISQFIQESQLIDAIRLATPDYHDDTAVRAELIGVQRPEFNFKSARIEEYFQQFYFLQIKNSTFPSINTYNLENDKTVKGIFYRKLAARLNSTDENERKKAQLALRYGMSAFAGEDFMDF